MTSTLFRTAHATTMVKGVCLAGSCWIIYRAFLKFKGETNHNKPEEEVIASHQLLNEGPEAQAAPLKSEGPEAAPLETVEDLWNYEPTQTAQFFRSHTMKVQLRRLSTTSSRLLVCHDMAGGYLNDRFIQGGSYSTAYRMFDWPTIDIFIYFGHTLITIPPACWIDISHNHGTRILGTFITEWDKGAEICAQLFSSEETATATANSLALVAQDFGFDGWLINIENKVSKENMKNVTIFLRKLTALLHDYDGDSQVIWYDSVTTEGELKWQDRLNELNAEYFDACDGIFTNYTWKKEYPAESAAFAGDRVLDVYYGIDVFGRNTYGGGGLSCNKALGVIKEAGVSAALFAPGWVMQNQMESGGVFSDEDNSDTWDMMENDFLQKSDEFWQLIRPYFLWHPLPSIEKTFLTFFNQGAGKQFWVEGAATSTEDQFWYNVSMQSLQLRPFEEKRSIARSINYNDAFDGGSSLLFKGQLKATETEIIPLYKLALQQPPGGLKVHVTYKASKNSNPMLQFVYENTFRQRDVEVLPINQSPSMTNESIHKEDQFLRSASNNPRIKHQAQWKHASFNISGYRDCQLVEVNMVCCNAHQEQKEEPMEFCCSLGGLSFGQELPHVEVTGLRVEECSQNKDEGSKSFDLIWNFDESAAFMDIFLETCSVPSSAQGNNDDRDTDKTETWKQRERVWIGRSFSNRFRVSNSNVTKDIMLCMQKIDLLGIRHGVKSLGVSFL